MAAPKAVSSSVKTPGLFLSVNLLGGTAGAGTSALKALVMAPRSASGDLTVDTEVRSLGSADDAATAFGPGTPGHLAAAALFRQDPLAQVDGIAPTASAGAAASETHVAGGSPTEATVVRVDIMGRRFDVPWNVGESATVWRDRAVLQINGEDSNLFVTASAGVGAGDLDLDAKIAGPWGNDVLTGAEFSTGGAGATITPGAAVLSGGTTEPDFTTALDTVKTEEYARIIACLSNADAADATASSNAARLATHIDTYESGLDALLQVGVVGVSDSIANAKAGAIARNNEAGQYVFGQAFQSLPSELAGSEAGDALANIAIRANFNRINNTFDDLIGPKDTVQDKLTPAEVEDLLNNGVTPVSLEKGTNRPFLVRPITTHSLQSGNPDFRAFDMTDIDGAFSVARDLRTAIPQQFANASLSPDQPDGADPLPPGVVEIKDVRQFVISRVKIHTRLGVVEAAALAAAVDSGELIVEIDAGDPTQANIFIPLSIIKPFAKQSVVVSKQ